MNKAYKIIWSKTKNCWVVASELAKRYTKAPKSGVISRFIGVGMLSCILSSTVMPSAFSAALSLGGGKANGVNTIAIGQYAIANPGETSNNRAFAFGMGYAENHSIIMDTYTYGTSSNGWVSSAYDYSVAIGYGNTAGIKRNSSNKFVHTNGYDLALGGQNSAIGGYSTAIGFQSKASGEYGTALGLQATASGEYSFTVGGTASGSHSTAIGRNSFAYGSRSVAIAGGTAGGSSSSPTNYNIAVGYESKASAVHSVALGRATNSSASGAVALGYGAVADTANTVSVGNNDLRRKIVNVANGTATNDAATYGQVSGAIKGLSVSGKTVTYTKIDGTTGTITTQDNDTTYSAATSSTLGLVKTGSNITNSGGTISLTKDNIVAALGYTPPTTDTNTTYSAMSADELNTGTTATGRIMTAKVLSDYVKSKTDDKIIGLSVSGKTITYTKGDGTTGTITTQDTNTTYNAFTGATSSAAGTVGLVKAPVAGDQNKFLRGDGTWAVDNNTTYANMSATELSTGTATTARSISAKVVSDYVIGKVSAETTARTTAINSEATTRADADTALGTRIDNATSAYQSADTGLSNRIGSVASDGTFIKKSATNSVATNLTALDTAAKNAIKGLSVSGTTITYTKGDGTTGTITTQDKNTTYTNMAASELETGTATTARSISAKVVSDYVKTKTDDKITGLSVNGKVITYTKGDGTTGTITTQDANTTYAAMSADELATGTAKSSRSITAKVLGDYVKGKTNDKISSLSINGNVITYTKGDGTTGTITTPNTTYSAGSGLTLNGTTLSVNTNGTATSGNAGVVSGGTLYNAIKDKVKYDSNDKSKISFGGTRGTVLSNLLGTTITADSTDAVTGGQLYAVKQDIAGFAEDISKHSESIRSMNTSVTSALSSVAASSLLVDTLDLSKADVSLNNLSDSGKEVLRTFARTAVQEYMAEQELVPSIAPMVSSTNDNTNTNTLSITNAGNGSLHVGEGSYVNGTSSIAIGVGNQVNANNSGAFGDPSIINADASYVLGNDDTINIGATGSFIVGNDGVSDAKGGLLFGSNTKATVDAEDGMALGNRAEVSAKNAIALGSGSIADTDNTLSIGNSNLKRKIVNVADGDISQNSSEAVTGAQLFVTNEKVQQNTEVLAKKADIDGGNINTSDWASKLGIGKVEDGNADLVTGGTVYDAIKGIGDNQLVKSNGDMITIGSNSTATVINVADANGQGRAITGVVTDVKDATSAANVGYVNQVSENIINATNGALQRVDNKINKAGANAAAIANLPTPTFDGEEKWAFAVGIGRYQGETAGAVGAFYKPTDNVIARVSGSFGNGDEMVGAGVAVSLNKGNTPAVSKAQLVRTINAQAERIQIVEKENASIRAENADIKAMREADRAEIAELKAMVADLAAKVK